MRTSWLVAAGIAAALVVPPAAGASPSEGIRATGGAAALLAGMDRTITALNTQLTRKRSDVAGATRVAQRSQVALARYEIALDALRSALGPVATGARPAGKHTLAASVHDALQHRADADARMVTTTTADAGAIQAQVDDAARRRDAFQRAIAGQRAATGSTGATYGWGGAGTLPVSAASIDRYLESKASPMTGQGEAFLRAGLKWDVDPRLVVAISGAESSFGLILCAPYNAWGYGCPSGPVAWGSWAEAIDAVTQGLRENYLGDGLTSVDRIHLRYAPPAATNDPNGLNYVWADNVARFLTEQGGNPQNVAGPGSKGPISNE